MKYNEREPPGSPCAVSWVCSTPLQTGLGWAHTALAETKQGTESLISAAFGVFGEVASIGADYSGPACPLLPTLPPTD